MESVCLFAKCSRISRLLTAVNRAIEFNAGRVLPASQKERNSCQNSEKGRNDRELIEQLMREIMNYDAQFRREDAAGVGTALNAIGEAFAQRSPC
jgi:hypothetical protein